ncbi:MAG TPA: maleylpyruvate isomerase family mycothiol-dependent enzyme [Streptosporangiaceae bacterium]
MRLRRLTIQAPATTAGYYAEIEASTTTLAGLLATRGATLAVPACPGWSLGDLTAHLGRVHRWAAGIVTGRPTGATSGSAAVASPAADDPGLGSWLTSGAAGVIAAIRAAGDEPAWAFGGQRPASFWARRMSHESMVHRADAELAAGQEPVLAPDLAADAIDEWLRITAWRRGDTDPRADALPAGAALHVHARPGAKDRGSGEWLVSHEPAGVTIQTSHAKADVAISGPADRLLLVLLRRLPPDDPAVTVHGDRGLLDRWLARTPF